MIQSRGQLFSLQERSSCTSGHGSPPAAALRSMFRARAWDPVPQVFVHSAQEAHMLTLQSVGQTCVLQVWFASGSSHAVPPCKGCTSILRERELRPVPHDALQPLHPPHALWRQSMGHAAEPHTAVSIKSGQPLPPNEGVVVASRCRMRMPPPQLTEQLVQSPNEVTTQSMGQTWGIHTCSAVSAPHALPPSCTAVATVRLLVCTPAPHVFEHALHADHCDSTQSTGHASDAHERSSASSGHT